MNFAQLTMIINEVMTCHLFIIFMSNFVTKFPKFLLIWQLLRIMQAKLLETSIFHTHNYIFHVETFKG